MSREIYRRSVGPHLDRVRYDGGTVPLDIQALIAIQRYYEERKDSIKLLYFPALTGNKIRVSGANNYISKGYDISPNSNDATQSTAVNQPYLGGNIAPNERYSLKNPNAGSNYMTHPIISFANGSNFSITTILNWNGNASVGCEGIYGGGYRSRFDIDFLTDYIRLATDGDVNFVIPNSLKYKRPGKSVIFTFVCSDSKYLLYANGNLIYTSPDILNTAFVTNYINRVWNPSFSYVKFYAHIIRSQALTPTEVANEYNLLRSYIPEIESVQIGTQTWATSNYEAVCTPQGNLIPEMQANVNVEKVVNGSFSDTSWWFANTNCSIADGVGHISNVVAGYTFLKDSLLTVGKWYKATITIKNYVSGSVYFQNGTPTFKANGTYTIYFNNTNSKLGIVAIVGTTLDIDDVSIQEVGWSDSQNLYDSIYAATSGTTEQKTYAAVKAAAMWCHYNNDPAIGAIYGKILNGFARRLMNMDLGYYNTNNPTTPWGWIVSLKSQLQTLVGFGGNALKVAGSVYMNDANGVNSTGFTALGQGKRNSDGTFSNLKAISTFWTQDTNEVLQLNSSDNTATIVSANEVEGHAIRLTKS